MWYLQNNNYLKNETVCEQVHKIGEVICMEELLELTKKQIRIQKIITALLAIILVMLLMAGVILVNQINKMSDAMDEAIQKIEEIDTDAMNDMIYETQELIESTDEYVSSMNEMIEQMEIFDSWLDSAFGR